MKITEVERVFKAKGACQQRPVSKKHCHGLGVAGAGCVSADGGGEVGSEDWSQTT